MMQEGKPLSLDQHINGVLPIEIMADETNKKYAPLRKDAAVALY